MGNTKGRTPSGMGIKFSRYLLRPFFIKPEILLLMDHRNSPTLTVGPIQKMHCLNPLSSGIPYLVNDMAYHTGNLYIRIPCKPIPG